jgi:queuosine precursor transporter
MKSNTSFTDYKKAQDPSIITNSFYPYLLCAFVITVVLGNLYALKIIVLFGLTTPAGMICFPFTFSICDIITDVYGRQATNRAIRTGVVALTFYYLSLTIITTASPAEIWDFQQEWETIFTHGYRIFLGTILGFYIGEKLNSFVLSLLKYLFQKQNLLTRYLTSTLIGVTFDTIIFSITAFLFVFPFSYLLHLIFTQLILKYFFEIIGSYIATKLSPIIKQKEGLDIIDSYRWIDHIKNKIK